MRIHLIVCLDGVGLEYLAHAATPTLDALGRRGVESVWARPEAAAEFQLHPGRIGDLFVLAAEDTAFGALPSPRAAVSVRTHGGRHTRAVPIIASGPGAPAGPFEHNYEAGGWVRW
jgi:hypothetical protein